jgi:hypothetical protein
MNSAAWVLMALAHVNSGSQVSFQEFDNQASCNVAGKALVAMATTAGEKLLVRCVSKAKGVDL